jgi:PAS domain S-box-containing protein
MPPFFQTLRFRLTLLILVALLPTAGIIIHHGLTERLAARLEAENDLRRLVTVVAREQEQLLRGTRQLLMALAETPAVRGLDAAAIVAQLTRIRQAEPYHDNLGVIGLDGYVLASVHPLTAPVYLGDRQQFQKARDTRDFAMSRLQISRILNKPTLVCTYPVRDDSGRVTAVLFVNLNLNWLQDLAAPARLPAGSVLAIVNPQRDIMMRIPNPEQWVGKTIPPGGIIDIILQHGQGMAEAPGMDGVVRLYTYAPLGPDPPLGYVFAGIPTRVVYAAASQALARNLAVLGGALALALGLAYGFGYLFIMRRINPLVEATARLAGGDLSARTGGPGGPMEFRQLGQAFDRMAASLEARDAERREAEAALHSTKLLMEKTLDSLQEVVLVVDPATHTILTCNPAAQRVLGYHPEEMVGRTTRFLYENQERFEEFGRKLFPALDRDGVFHIDYRMVRRDGKVIFTEHTVVEMLDDSGRRMGVVSVIRDITTQKQAEESRRQAEERFRAAFEFGPMGMALSSAGGRLFHVNRAFCEMLGYTAVELLNLNYQELTHPQDLESDYVWRGRLLAGEAAAFDQEKRYVTRQGETIWTSTRTALLRYADGSPQFFITQVLDITARRRAEENLRRSEQKFRLLYDNAPLGYQSLDQDGLIIEVNRTWLDLLGYSREQVIGKWFGDFLAPAYVDHFLKNFPCFKEAGDICDVRFEMVRQDGSFISVSFNGRIAYDDQGQFLQTHCMFQDISAQKQAEAERDRLFNLSIDMLCIAGFDGYFKQLNPAWEKVLGWTDQELLAKPWLDFVYPEDRAATIAAGAQLTAGQTVYGFENRYQCRDGSYLWFAWNSFPLLEEGLMFCVARDVTAHKQAEAALAESEQRYRLLAENIQDVFWMATPGIDRMIYVSPAYEKIWGRSCDSLYESPGSFIDALHPEDRDRVVAALEEYRSQGTAWSLTFRVVRPDGSIRWVEDRGFPVLDEQGQWYLNTGVATDITARKEAEQEIIRQSDQLRALAARLAEVEETERTHLARELHDQVGQNLSALGVDLNLLQVLLPGEAGDQLRSRLADSAALLDQTVALVRDLMVELRPPVLDEYGLLEALRWYGARFSQRMGIAVDFEGEDFEPRLAPEIEISLFRIAQEALTNVAKHARATRVRVAGEVDNGKVRLTIADNGVGFDAARRGLPEEGHGWGLMNMTERALAAGGHCQIESQPGQGARVVVEVPR